MVDALRGTGDGAMTTRESRVCKMCAGRGVFRWAVTDGACSEHAAPDARPLREPIVPIVNDPGCGHLVCEAAGMCFDK